MVATIIVPLSAPNSAQETRLGSQQWIDQGKHWLLILLDRWGEVSWIFDDFRLSLGPSFAPSRIFLACLRCGKKLAHRAIQGYPRKLRCLSIPSFLILRLPNLLLKGMVTGQILRSRVPMDTTDFGNL